MISKINGDEEHCKNWFEFHVKILPHVKLISPGNKQNRETFYKYFIVCQNMNDTMFVCNSVESIFVSFKGTLNS